MLNSALEALSSFADPGMLLYLLAGVLVGLIIGVIPGLGGTGAVAVLIPFVFVLEPNEAIAMIIGAVAVVHTSDVITSVVLGIPGSAAASVFLLDGHPMAKKGQASRALSASFISSAIGGLIGIVALTLIVPVARPLVSAFGTPEVLMLIVLGIYLTGLLSQGNMLKGLALAAFGLILGMVGPSPTAAEYRYTFGSEYLTDGVGLVAAALGIFGVAEIIHLVAKRTAVTDSSMELGSGWWHGAKDVTTYKGEVLRGSAVGIGAGIVPGLGGTAGAWLAYGQAKALAARRRDTVFGKGDPRGVIAPSAASNSIESGSLIPTLLFGVPGAAPFALLLGVLLIFGIQPGPDLIESQLDIVYFIVWAFAIASVVGSFIAFFMAKPLAKLSFVRFPVIAAALIPILFLSGFQEPLNLGVFYTMLILGIVGWVCKVSGVPRAPFLIAYVLAIPLERYYFITVAVFDPLEWLTRPFVLVVIGLLVTSTCYIVVKGLRLKNKHKSMAELSEEMDSLAPPYVHVVFSGVSLLVFGFTLVWALGFSPSAQLFPLTVSIIGAVLSATTLLLDVRACKSRTRNDDQTPRFHEEAKTVIVSTIWIVVYMWLVFIAGMSIGSVLFVIIFLLRVARVRLISSLIYAAVVYLALWILSEYAQLTLPSGWIF